MSGHYNLLAWAVTNLTTYAVSIADGYVKELTAACSLVMCYCSLNHVTKVVEFMAAALLGAPAGGA